uniref:phage late control D family protein n=1 Tax=Cupriavidus yeoncheonensis TaxID=1462994 RepID=UPI003F4943A1
MPLLPSALQSATVPQIKVEGEARAELSRDLTLLQLDEDINGMKRLAATLIAIGPRDGERDEQLNWLDGRVLDFGKELKVFMGPTDAREEMFSGRLSAMELQMDQGRAPEVCCLAEDKLMDLRMTRRFQTYENVSEADLVQQIAAKHGLSAVVDINTPVWKMVQQWNQSDLAFLRERARRLAAEVWVEGSRLHMATREQRNGNAVTLIQGSNLFQVRLCADLAHQRSKVVVNGFDDAQQDPIDEEAGAETVAAEAQGHTHGIQVLERAFAERSSFRVREVPLTDAQASALARAALLGRARRFVTASGVADGSPAIQVGSLLRLERVSPAFEGDGYYVTRVRHQFDLTHGYRTHFDAERAWIGGAA